MKNKLNYSSLSFFNCLTVLLVGWSYPRRPLKWLHCPSKSLKFQEPDLLSTLVALSQKKKKKQKTKVVRCARCEQCSAEAQTTRSRAIEPGPSSPTPEKRQTPRAANGHRVPNPKHLLQLTLMRCIPTFIHRKVYILRTYYCLLHTRFLFCN